MHAELQPKDFSPEISHPSTTAAELLGRSIVEPNGLQMAAAPIHISSRIVDGNNTRFSAHIDYSLSGKDFLTVLNQVAPVDGQTEYGIIGDWKMPDQARDKERNVKEDKQRLRRHGTMMRDWADFMANRQEFMGTLMDRFNVDWVSRIAPQLLINDPSVDTTSRAVVEALHERARMVGLSPFATLHGEDVTIYQFIDKVKQDIAQYMQAHTELWKPKQLKNGTHNIPASAINRFWTLGLGFKVDYFQKHPETSELVLNEKFIEEAIDRHMRLQGHMMVKDSKGKRTYLDQTKLYGHSITQKVDGQFIIGDENDPVVSATVYVDEEGKKGIRVDAVKQTPASEPLIEWEKDKVTGERKFYVRPGDVDSVTDKPLTTKNPLLGLFALAYFEPELREEWESKLFLEMENEKGEMEKFGPQQNGAAQIPVYILMKRDEIASQSKLLPAVEQFAIAHSL